MRTRVKLVVSFISYTLALITWAQSVKRATLWSDNLAYHITRSTLLCSKSTAKIVIKKYNSVNDLTLDP